MNLLKYIIFNVLIWLGISILIWFSSFFSSCETAISSFNKIRIKKMAVDGNAKAKMVLDLNKQYSRALTALLIGNNILNIFVSTVGAVIFTSYFGAIGAGVSTIFFTLVLLIFAEIIPKTIANRKPEAICLKNVRAIYFFIGMFTPLIFLFDKIRSIISGGNVLEKQPTITEPELKFMLEEIQNQGILEDTEGRLVSSALDLDEVKASEIMTPRVDLVTVEINFSVEQVKNLFLTEKYSRLPVYEGSIDNIVGVISEKDFFREYLSNRNFELKNVVQKAFLVPPQMNVAEIMRNFQQGKPHMAMVVDQYGGIEGVITFVDVVEQLFGEIYDEKGFHEKNILKISENVWSVNPIVSVDEMFDEILGKVVDVETKSSTVGGWVFEMLGKVPKNGDSFKYGNIKIVVKKMHHKRVTRVLVKLEC